MELWEQVQIAASIHRPQFIGPQAIRMRCGLPYIRDYAATTGWQVTCKACLATVRKEHGET